jgi:peroxiredoxin
MNVLLYALLYFLSADAGAISPGMRLPATDGKNNEISIELRLNPKQVKDSGKVSFVTAEYILYSKPQSEYRKTSQGSLRIAMSFDVPAFLNFSDLLRVDHSGFYLTEPGDDVVINSNGQGFYFTGRGADKYRFQYLLDSLERSIPRATQKKGSAAFLFDSFEEYQAWARYYQQKINIALPLFQCYKGKISELAYSVIVDQYIRDVISGLNTSFHNLQEFGISGKKVSYESLVQLYDTSHSKHVQEWLGYAVNKQLMALELKVYQIERMYSFDSDKMPGAKEIRLIQLQDMMKNFKGRDLERLMVNNLPQAMSMVGFTTDMEKLLKTYYATPGYIEWKKWMQEQELNIRVRRLSHRAPDFSITDTKGKVITKNDLQGKIAVLYFPNIPQGTRQKADEFVWQKAMEKYKKHPGVVFVSVSAEKSDPVFKDFAITSFPWIWVMDSTGRVINSNPKIDFTKDKGEKLAAFIQKKFDDDKALHQKNISIKKDGPYVFHTGNELTSCSIDDTSLIRSVLNKSTRQQLTVQTDLEKTFIVQLQTSVAVQPAVYPACEKLLVFSDIEGNFDAFRKLLQANKVIDDNFNWIFDKGHLVFAGDMFDRGMQVTECLWLMYVLEEKAKAAGGYVHFVLGNHEIMNMQGAHHYTRSKYKTNAALMGKTLTELYSENSELGRWLRTKNIVEKIGDLLFVHGGISPEMNRLSLGIEDINALARPYYGIKIDSTNRELLTIYDSRHGERYRISPFWSRGYYKTMTTQGIGKISNQQLDTTLNKFNVRRIITGHTVVADTISIHYEGRVINTDTKHAKGLSEALLIEGNRYYRVNLKGDKVLLFIDDKIKRG